MDDLVLKAMQRWPDVPAVHGWLSLDARGRWKLHPTGGAANTPAEPGESISNPSLLAFINRNYAADEQGRWFFQNGPQRVYAQLEAAPYVIRLAEDGIGLQTHTGLPVDAVHEWLPDDEGHMYVRTALGPGRIEDRDLPALLPRLETDAGNLLDALEQGATHGWVDHPQLPRAPWRQIPTQEVSGHLGFLLGPTQV
ncbi:DUF2946 family protein [Pusillimonas sp. CC-YST705]|uniref:DUF2946 family protein n=1 Tax=Mesopusillimonas faecipullorum TaxID=2755040 RepID=A0ABS8C823_9BURK|nr:DUF2946 family protein [Mesopusillimonas faecipullorum]MCB5362178.1 DUF2946 family protein [Mesopusillimonas faecipullorum]